MGPVSMGPVLHEASVTWGQCQWGQCYMGPVLHEASVT